MNSNQDPYTHPTTPAPRQRFWQRFGAGSLTISVGLHLILLVAGLIWVFQIIPAPPEEPKIWTKKGTPGSSSAETQSTKTQTKLTRTNLPRIAVETISSTNITKLPEMNDMSAMTSMDGPNSLTGIGKRGTGQGTGNDIFGKGPGGSPNGGDNFYQSGFKLLPPLLSKRCSKQDRIARIKQNGGTEACEDSVINALRWLKANQNADGSWGKETSVAMTGLALLAYFGHCENPASDEFGDSCARGIVWLVDLGMKGNGPISTNPTANHSSYEHAIATYALAEATVFSKEGSQEIPYLKETTLKAGQYIIDHQNKNGGWAYSYVTDGGHTDLSVAGWQIQALAACDHANLTLRGMNSCRDKGLDYVNRCQSPEGGFGYTGPGKPPTDYYTLTGVGMLCNQMWDKGNRPEVRKGSKYILENTKFDYNSEFCDLYGHYYESQAMMQRGGKDWDRYNEIFRDQLLQNQDADGSWKTPGGGKKARATGAKWQQDKLYRTCLCTLMMEVYYRFLGSGGDAARPKF